MKRIILVVFIAMIAAAYGEDKKIVIDGFTKNSSYITEEMQKKITKEIDEIKNKRWEIIRVRGHASSIGNEEHNFYISEERAESIKKYLIENGVDDKKIVSDGAGERFPAANEDNEAGIRKNMRVEIILIDNDSQKNNETNNRKSAALKTHLTIMGGVSVFEKREEIKCDYFDKESINVRNWFDNFFAGGEITGEVNKTFEAGGGVLFDIIAKEEIESDFSSLNIPVYGIIKGKLDVVNGVVLFGKLRGGVNLFGRVDEGDEFSDLKYGGVYFGCGAGIEYKLLSVEGSYSAINYCRDENKEEEKITKKLYNIWGVNLGVKIW